MRLLILGGTRFLGLHLAEAALRAGDAVTVFHRGRTGPDLLPGAEHRFGDRDGGLDALADGVWDAVVDTSGYVPRLVKAAARKLADRVGHYTFVSSVSVYDRPRPGTTEDAPVLTLADPSTEIVDEDTYGALKALCEEAAESAMPGRVLCVRPGLIVGPEDPTDRFTYWVRRVAAGNEVLVPEPPDRGLQFIHAGDLAQWMLSLIRRGETGRFNATGPRRQLSMREFLETCRTVSGSDARFTWVSEGFLKEEGVTFWRDLPLCLPPEERGTFAVSVEKAVAHGLAFRPLSQVVRETLDWDAKRDVAALQAGLSASREADLLRRWRESEGSAEAKA